MLMNKILELKASIIASVALAGVVLGAILAFGGFSHPYPAPPPRTP